MKKILILFLSVLMLMTFAGCLDSSKDDEEQSSLKIVNNDIQTVQGIYLENNPATTWHTNLLSTPVAAGATFTITDIEPGTYDIGFLQPDGGGTPYDTITDNPSGIEFEEGKTIVLTVTTTGYSITSISSKAAEKSDTEENSLNTDKSDDSLEFAKTSVLEKK